jgi:hypothetical protein
MLFEDNFVFNGDDCLTVGSPAKNIHFRNSYCNGGHGLSIGSLGSGGAIADVQDVLYVVHMLVELGSLTSPSKDRKCYYGKALITMDASRPGVYLRGAGKYPLWSEVQELDRRSWYS